MSWRPASRRSFRKTVQFFKTEEWKHAALSSRIREYGQPPRFGQIADGRLWVLERDSNINGTLYISRYGVVLPSYDPVNLTAEEGQFLRRLLLPRRDRLFSVIGMENVVSDIEKRLGEIPPDTVNYRLLTESEDPARTGLFSARSDLEFGIAGPQDVDKLWPLEKAYQLEEVLRKGSRLNDKAAKRHFLSTLKNQVVHYIVLDGRPVAKAGTNARGWKWDQVGGVFVVPELRGGGLAKQAMIALLKSIHEKGKGACLFVKKDNRAAMNLYNSLGFVDRGSFKISYWS